MKSVLMKAFQRTHFAFERGMKKAIFMVITFFSAHQVIIFIHTKKNSYRLKKIKFMLTLTSTNNSWLQIILKIK